MTTVTERAIFSYGGKTIVALAPDNSSLCAANKKGLTKVVNLDNPEEEPVVLDIVKDATSIRCSSTSSFVLTAHNGDALLYDIKNASSQLLARFGLPVRDCVVIHSGAMVAFGGDDLDLTLVDLSDNNFTRNKVQMDDQISQLSYSPKTNLLAASLINGNIQIFSLASTQPNKLKLLKGYIPANSYDDNFKDSLLMKTIHTDQASNSDLDDDDEEDDTKVKDPEFCNENRICTRVTWHPNGLYFAVPSVDGAVKIFNVRDYSLVKTLSQPNSSKSKFIDLQFDLLQGDFIAAVDLNNQLVIWNWQTSQVHYIKQFKKKITNLIWKTQQDSKHLSICLGTWTGFIITVNNVAEITGEQSGAQPKAVTEKPTKSTSNGLFVDDDSDEEEDIISEKVGHITDMVAKDNGNEEEEDNDSENIFTQEKPDEPKRRTYYGDDDEEDDFIDDDDGAGYVIHKKPKLAQGLSSSKRFDPTANAIIQSNFHYKPVSQGSTPFNNSDRRYLTMNNIGYVSTVGNNEQYSVTVSFFDVGKFSEYHFEDLFGYDICSLNEKGTLFAQSSSGQLHYRPHDTHRSNWTKIIPLSKGEILTCVAATPKRVIVGTSLGYIRIFNQYGVPFSVEKMSPIVAVAAQGYRVFTVHYSPYHGISFSLFEESPSQVKFYQRESSLPISMSNQLSNNEGNSNFKKFNPLGLKSLFFSEYGDPCIFGSDDVLLILNKWRNNAESRWVPVLDSNLEVWKMAGGKENTDVHVWPLGLTYDILNCILVKGKNFWPVFPLPLPSEMELRIPILVKKQLLDDQKAKLKEENEILANGEENENNEDKEIEISPNLAAEEVLVRSKVLSDLLTDTLENDGEIYGNENEVLNSLNGAYDKAVLRLFAVACSDQNVEKAFSLVSELKQDRALTAAAKISERAEMLNLMKRINDLRESRFEQQLNNI